MDICAVEMNGLLSQMALKRLHAEWSKWQKDDMTHISASPVMAKEIAPNGKVVEEPDMFRWVATIVGPERTPYEGGIFKLQIDIPDKYPMVPPSVKFVTKIYHPNISTEGIICLDILKHMWSPALDLAKTLLSILSILSDPNAKDPLNGEAGRSYLQDRPTFDSTAREWTRQYAQ